MEGLDRRAYRVLEYVKYGDERGNLVVEGNGKDTPFEIKRAFYIHGSDATVVRRQHANRKSALVLINVSGNSKVLVDTGEKREVILLDRPRKGLYLGPMTWKGMYDFSPDAALLVSSSEHYGEAKYIRIYEDFFKEIRG